MTQVVGLQVENFQIIRTIDLRPEGNVIKIGGKNEQGKSSLLEAIWVALRGRAVAPPQPIRAGEEKCRIRLDLGELVITRTFTAKEGGDFTDSVKVENAEGLRFPSPQAMLNDLLGAVGFDPFEFTKKKPEQQAEMLLELVPLSVDLEEHAQLDASDYAKRRDVNRDAESLKAQIDAIPEESDLPEIDRNALADQLAGAADTNSAIERDRRQREEDERSNQRGEANAAEKRRNAALRREEAARLIEEAERFEREAGEIDEAVKTERERLAALPPLDSLVDTAGLRRQLDTADDIQRRRERQATRAKLVAAREQLVAEAEGYTALLASRKRAREEALAKARMPIEGLAFAINNKGKPVVTYHGVPFEQASTAVQIRASTAIAMAANPELRVLRIKDGSLLDEDSMAIIEEMARDGDFQLWVEVVGTGGVGIVIENGSVKGAAEASPAADAPPAEEKPKAKAKAKGKQAGDAAATDGSLL